MKLVPIVAAVLCAAACGGTTAPQPFAPPLNALPFDGKRCQDGYHEVIFTTMHVGDTYPKDATLEGIYCLPLCGADFEACGQAWPITCVSPDGNLCRPVS